jgi:hypothetical protein
MVLAAVAATLLGACSTPGATPRVAVAPARQPAALPLAAATPAAASGISEPDWRYTGTTEDDAFASYVDVGNLVTRNGHRYAWIKRIYRHVQRDASGKAYKASTALVAYDCTNHTRALVSSAYYSETGSVVHSMPPVAHLEWDYVIPESIGAANFQMACANGGPETTHAAHDGNGQTVSFPIPSLQSHAVAHPRSPAEIFKSVKSSVWILLSFDLKHGKPDLRNAAQGSAIAVGPTTLLTNCHTLKGHRHHGIVQLETDRAMPVQIREADYAGDRCVLEAFSTLPSHVDIKPYAVTDVGEEAYSIGTPQGLELTMANGIVSAKRTLNGVRYLQTTAPISPGSSGGGLFASDGRLIGITTFFRKDSQNLNFAIAADAF